MKTLKGKKILVTREKAQAATFETLIEKYNGTAVCVPLLQIKCRTKSHENVQILEKIDAFNWIFFTSAHGVNCFFNEFASVTFTQTNFATVGHKTASALKEHGYHAAFIPSTYNAEVMAKEFFEKYSNANHILLVRGNLSRKLLVTELTKRKLNFNTLIVYDTVYYRSMKTRLLNVLVKENLDYITFTSPSTVKAFIEMIENHPNYDDFLQIPTVCIGTTTEKTANEFDFKQTFTPKMFTIDSMVETMIHLNI